MDISWSTIRYIMVDLCEDESLRSNTNKRLFAESLHVFEEGSKTIALTCSRRKKTKRRRWLSILGVVSSVLCLLCGLIGVIVVIHIKLMPMDAEEKESFNALRCQVLKIDHVELDLRNHVRTDRPNISRPPGGQSVKCYIIQVLYYDNKQKPAHGIIVDTFNGNIDHSSKVRKNTLHNCFTMGNNKLNFYILAGDICQRLR